MDSTATLIDQAWQSGRIAGPQTVAWLKSLQPLAARRYINSLGGTVINPERAQFGSDEAGYQAYQKAAARGDVRILGGAA
ncbi:hypothetical protein [Thiocystis violacea]|uniref:hypothetical protein n=1 Tax=Thiocystis violacea TaxID=13725 RepID=UPI0019080333|nr:hypothetical protein [Thiocystis violacea]